MNTSSQRITPEQLRSLLSPLSHDLKNSLTNIYLYAQIVDKKLTDEHDKKQTQKILTNIQKFDQQLTIMGELIKTFYDEYTYNIESVRLENVVDTIKKTFPEYTLVSPEIFHHTVDVDTHKLIRLLLVCLSRLEKKSVIIKINEIGGVVQLEVTGKKANAGQFSEELIGAYVTITAQQLFKASKKQAGPYDLVFTFHTQ